MLVQAENLCDKNDNMSKAKWGKNFTYVSFFQIRDKWGFIPAKKHDKNYNFGILFQSN